MTVQELFSELNKTTWSKKVEFDLYIYLGQTKITKVITDIVEEDDRVVLQWEDKE